MIPKDYSLIIKEMELARMIILDINEVGKKRFLFNSFIGLADEQLFLEKYSSQYYTGPFLSELFPIPLQGLSSFLFIAVWIASQLFTWRAVDLFLNTCHIIALLVVVE